MLIALTTVWLVGLVVSYADARLPPKFLKATNNVGKIYAGRYGYTVVPVTPKFLVQSVARKEVHVPVLRPVRKKRRPLNGPRRPGPPPPSVEYGSSSYHDYPQTAASKKHPRLRKPPKFRRKPRPPPRDPDYYEQEIEDDSEDFAEYDYEDKHHERPSKGYEDRPFKRGYSSSVTKSHEDSRPKGPIYNGDRYKTRFEDDDEFIAQHSEFYASGYPPGKSKSRPPRVRDHDDIEHHFGPPPGRKSKPPPKGFKPSRPSSKLYSASVAPPRRPTQYHKDEDRFRYEDEDEEDVSPRPRYKKKPKVTEEEVYDETSHYKESEKDSEDKETGYSRPGGVIHEEYEYNPDNFYHDRKFEPKQKSKRGTEDKEKNGGGKQRPRRPEIFEESRPFHPSELREEEHRGGERREPPRRKKEKPSRAKQEESHQQEHRAPPEGKWSIPFSLEPEDEDVWEDKSKVTEKTPRKQSETNHELSMPPRPKKVEEKPVSEYETAQSTWPVIVQGLNWKDAPHPFVEHQSPELFSNWQNNFQIPQWPNLDEQLGKFPESLRSTFKWVEPTNQTPLHPTPTPPNHRTTTPPAIAIPPVDYSRGIGSQSNSDTPKRKKSSKRSKDRPRDGTEVVAQRIVGGTLQLNGGFRQETPKDEWANPAFLSASKNPGRSPQQQYTVEMFKSVEPGKPSDGDIVYGTRIADSKSRNIEPDIGYHSGMETIDDDIGGWQVY
ncbi:hypothetical protein GE061_004179 [Apolygus lucorum]|uniref:Uncharacterized protein n=1 Tax=Apolygus lucorum TaxID=248454 RepID=A0A8S9WZY1_APOLU|nr:hypothetical protein GE061_004179 [Apolygus lucorum]